MKKILLVLLVFSFIGLNTSVFAVDSIKKEAGYVSLNASESVEMAPNIARVSFSVENTASSAQNATKENNEVSNSVINALKAITTTGTDVIKTNNFSVRPVYTTLKDGSRVIKNYTAVNSITVETKDIKKVSSFIDAAIAAGANRTENLYYSYENDKKLCAEYYPKMLKELRLQADSIASAVGSSVDGVKNIYVSCSMHNTVVSNARFLSAKSAGFDTDEAVPASAPLEEGKVKINVSVNVDFYVK